MYAMKRSSKTTSFKLSVLTCLLVSMLAILLFSPVFAADESPKAVNTETSNNELGVTNPSTDLWRAVRQREFEGSNALSSSSQVKSLGSAQFINIQGQEWRNFRMGQLVPYAAYLLGGVLLVIALFRLIRGKIKIKSGRSGKKILRFSPFQRFVHWSTAILFIILSVTGLILTFGKTGLIPIIGSEAFGPIAGFGRMIHDYLGPVFGIMLTIMLFTFIKGNFTNLTDVKWFLKGGGLFGGHASAGRYNGGEKAWFWLAILGGAVVVVSGVILDFPFFGQTREDLQLSHVVHAIGAVLLLAASLGHIYMGTIAMEGAFEAMKTGYCDENWAKEHHDIWYSDLEKQGIVRSSSSDSDSNSGSGTASNSGTDYAVNKKTATPSSLTTDSKVSEETKTTETKENTSTSEVVTATAATTASVTAAVATEETTTAPSTSEQDNLKKIEGIGPKIEEILQAAGVSTYEILSKSQYDDLKAILNDAGSRYKMHNPTTWPEQAELAAKGAWDELSELQDRI